MIYDKIIGCLIFIVAFCTPLLLKNHTKKYLLAPNLFDNYMFMNYRMDLTFAVTTRKRMPLFRQSILDGCNLPHMIG